MLDFLARKSYRISQPEIIAEPLAVINNMNNNLKTFLKNDKLSEQSINILCNAWNSKHVVKKNDFLLQKNKKEHYLYFILTGCLATILEDEKKDFVLGFGYENSLINSYISFVTEKTSPTSLKAICDTELLKISKKELFKLTKSYSEIANWYHSKIEKTLVGHLNRQIELVSLTPEQHYKAFLKRSGKLVNTIPLKYISSYLNMTPETLSRVRKLIS